MVRLIQVTMPHLPPIQFLHILPQPTITLNTMAIKKEFTMLTIITELQDIIEVINHPIILLTMVIYVLFTPFFVFGFWSLLAMKLQKSENFT